MMFIGFVILVLLIYSVGSGIYEKCEKIEKQLDRVEQNQKEKGGSL